MENGRNGEETEFISKDDNEKIFQHQSKLSFKGIQYSYTNFDNYTLKQNEVLMDKPKYLGFAALELNKMLIYGTYYDKLQPCSEEKT